MAVVHEHTVRTSCTTSQLPLASDGAVVALPHGRSSIAIYSLQDVTCKPLLLEGHHKAVNALNLSWGKKPSLLCSCSDDCVIVWDVIRARTAVENGETAKGFVIGTSLGRAQHCSFSTDDLLVAVCVGKNVLILDSTKEQINATLEGHNAVVNCAGFCPHYSSTLVTASDDRTFKIWDISNSLMVYQSSIISPSPFITLTMDSVNETFALGTVDGQVRVYDLTDGNGFRCLQNLDIHKLLRKLRDTKEREEQTAPEKDHVPKIVSSRPLWQRAESCPHLYEEVEEETEESEAGSAIIGLLYVYKNSQSAAAPVTPLPFLLQRDNSLLSELLQDAPMLIVVTTGAIIQVNAKTLEPCSYHDLLESLLSSSVMESRKVINLAGSCALASSADTEVKCVLSNIFGIEINILNLSHPTELNQNELKMRLATYRLSQAVIQERSSTQVTGDTSTDLNLTVLSCTPLLPGSPLRAELTLKPKEIPVRSKLKGGVSKSTGVEDKPITFRCQVKSSGYTEKPRTTMFKPQTNSPKSPASGRTTRSSSLTGEWRKSNISSSLDILTKKQYPLNSGPPNTIHARLDVADRPTAITCVTFSEDGQHLACSLANTSTQVFKMPLTGKGCAFTGHDASVTSVRWSRDNRWLLSSCDDKTACVWSLGLPDPVMTLNMVHNNFGADKEGGVKPTQDNPKFSKAVKFAQFYYMDKFILLAHGNAFNLYKYHLDTSKSDIKRYLSSNRYKLVRSFGTAQTQQITAFSAVNGFHSSSNRCLDVFDMNAGKCLRTIPDVHSRTVHTICQNAGSSYVSHPSSSYDLFVTAAASDCIKLWDLRTSRCVRRYEGHSNRIHPCGVSISPCSRFIATGSEDRSAYIYDIRSGTYVQKLTGHTETVGDVTFHPLYPQLVTASLDGKIRLFTTS